MGTCSFDLALASVETIVVFVPEVAMKPSLAFENDFNDSWLLMIAPVAVDFVFELLARKVVGAMPLCLRIGKEKK